MKTKMISLMVMMITITMMLCACNQKYTNSLFVKMLDVQKNEELANDCVKDDEIIINEDGLLSGDTQLSGISSNYSYVTFGEYPQTIVSDKEVIDYLIRTIGELPTEANSHNWTSYNYFIGGHIGNYMWYIDREYNGERYRGVYMTHYRPYYTTSASSKGSSYQDDNGYRLETIYWFKFEPIKWRILNQMGNTTLLLANCILDAQEFYQSPKGYSYKSSSIRSFLNGGFYNVAFNTTDKSKIVSTNISDNAQNNDEDKVFLLSDEDVKEEDYGFSKSSYDTARQIRSSDYAQIQGVYTNKSESSSFFGNGLWWIRSSNEDDTRNCYASYVDVAGYADDDGMVNFTYRGVVPAITIQL